MESLGWIKATVTNQYQLMLLKCRSAFEGWNSLEKLLSPVSATQVQVIRDQLKSLKKISIDSIQDYLVKVKGLVESLAANDYNKIEIVNYV